MRRRTFLSTTAVTGLELAARRVAAAQSSPAGQSGPISVGWLGGTSPLADSGISWGVPWPRGSVRKDQSFTLSGADGKALPLQSWPLAYWPDGSLKWSGLATVASAGAAGPFRVAPGTPTAPAGGTAVTVRQTAGGIDIDTGKLQCHLPLPGIRADRFHDDGGPRGSAPGTAGVHRWKTTRIRISSAWNISGAPSRRSPWSRPARCAPW